MGSTDFVLTPTLYMKTDSVFSQPALTPAYIYKNAGSTKILHFFCKKNAKKTSQLVDAFKINALQFKINVSIFGISEILTEDS